MEESDKTPPSSEDKTQKQDKTLPSSEEKNKQDIKTQKRRSRKPSRKSKKSTSKGTDLEEENDISFVLGLFAAIGLALWSLTKLE